MRKLNRGQQCIIFNVLSKIQNNERFDIFLSGGSGVGKSRVLQAIYQSVIRYYHSNQDPIHNIAVIGAYTGKAAFNVGGLTLHSLFHLPTKQGPGRIPPLSSAILMKCRENYKFTLLFIIDEISLVGSKIFASILSRVHQITEVRESGNLKVSFLVVGDFAQLKPVLDKWIFENKGFSNPISKIVGPEHWKDFKMFELTEIMRQREDKLFAETLRVIGDQGIEFCSKEQIQMLDSRIKPGLEEIPDDTIILCFSNQKVREFNRKRIENCGLEIIENRACDYAEGKDCNTNIAKRTVESCRNLSMEDANNLPYKILFVIGKKYMLTTNLKTSDGLAHGNVGRLMKIIYHKGNSKPHRTLVKRVYLLFSDPNIGERTRATNKHQLKDRAEDSWTVIEIQDICLKNPKYKNYDFHVNRLQLPLVECEAMTIHKSQGQTYESVAVYIGDHLNQQLMYVALSRATSLEGLHLFGETTILRNKLTAKKLEALKEYRSIGKAKEEMKRLREYSLLENKFPFIFTGK